MMNTRHFFTLSIFLGVIALVLGAVYMEQTEEALDKVAVEVDGTLMNRWSRAPAAAHEEVSTESIGEHDVEQISGMQRRQYTSRSRSPTRTRSATRTRSPTRSSTPSRTPTTRSPSPSITRAAASASPSASRASTTTPTCDSNSCRGIPIDMNSAQITQILNEHNWLRGNISRPAPTNKLSALTWDSDLANIWKSHPFQCKFQHTTNEWRSNVYANATHRAPFSTTYAGENLAYYAQYNRCTGNTINTCQKVLTYDLNNLLYGWGRESACYGYGKIGSDYCNQTCYQALYSDGCGHYTQQIWENTARVGCMVVNCTQYDLGSPQYGFMFVCAYAQGGNYVGSYPYRSSVSGKRSDELATEQVHINTVEEVAPNAEPRLEKREQTQEETLSAVEIASRDANVNINANV